jgi:hypothetical protein
MRLIDLNPNWVSYGGSGVWDKDHQPIPFRNRVGLTFDCPCGCDSRCYIGFLNPDDGGPPVQEPAWKREGEDFESLTLTPSIQRRDPGGCRWHGFITNGEALEC